MKPRTKRPSCCTEEPPQDAYQNLLNGPLDKITKFRIKDFQDDSLILQRTYDGEIFHWVRTDQR